MPKVSAVDNPYKPPEFQGNETVRPASLVRIVVGIIASLFGVVFFGLGTYATWMAAKNIGSTTVVLGTGEGDLFRLQRC